MKKQFANCFMEENSELIQFQINILFVFLFVYVCLFFLASNLYLDCSALFE